MTTTMDEATFTELAERHRRELHVHCYRMLASVDEADDAVQETMLRAWRRLDGFDGQQFRAWLYRIATNVCLDLLRARARARRAPAGVTPAEVPWLQAYPDPLLDEVTGERDDAEPGAIVVDRETIELAFLVALQLLPPRQRAALLVRDVLGWPAAETAEALDTTVAATNSALQRARATLQSHLGASRSEWRARRPSPHERALVEAFIDAHERCDAAAAVAIAAPGLRVTMPPQPFCHDGLDQVTELLERAFGPEREGDWRLLPTAANRQPAAASYLRRPGDVEFRAFKLDVLRVEGDRIAEITTFGWVRFPDHGLPLVLPARLRPR